MGRRKEGDKRKWNFLSPPRSHTLHGMFFFYQPSIHRRRRKKKSRRLFPAPFSCGRSAQAMDWSELLFLFTSSWVKVDCFCSNFTSGLQDYNLVKPCFADSSLKESVLVWKLLAQRSEQPKPTFVCAATTYCSTAEDICGYRAGVKSALKVGMANWNTGKKVDDTPNFCFPRSCWEGLYFCTTLFVRYKRGGKFGKHLQKMTWPYKKAILENHHWTPFFTVPKFR